MSLTASRELVGGGGLAAPPRTTERLGLDDTTSIRVKQKNAETLGSRWFDLSSERDFFRGDGADIYLRVFD